MATRAKGTQLSVEQLKEQLILTGAQIKAIGEEAEILVGGKNYNTALIHEVAGVQSPQFRAISSICFHKLLDETKVNAALIRSIIEREYSRIDWNDPVINNDSEFLQKLVRTFAKEIKIADEQEKNAKKIPLRMFVNNVVEGFATSQEVIDQLRKRSVLVQSAILSVEMPKEVGQAVREAYMAICKEAGENNIPVAVRSSAAGEDSRKKAFAGLQDTYLNMVGPDSVELAYHWDCASAYNLRSMTYRREAIRDGITKAEETGDMELALQAKQEWAIENTSLSVCMMRMIRPVIAGTAFSADTSTGCRGTDRKDLVSIDASYGLGEAIVGGMVTPDKFYVYQRDDMHEVVIRNLGHKGMKIVYDEKFGGTKKVDVDESDIYKWSLTIAQAEQIAKCVRLITAAYGGMIMDTEFCIDAKEQLWFVQARPETRWNEEFEEHPDIIYMRRLEVDKKALRDADVLLEGNGASRGAGQGRVKFLRSALELNKITKGDILAAERTDPDMVPGMRVASAILADVGGDTSHAAITSRELGIAAIIGIQRAEALRSLDGLDVTVDGTAGRVYRGLLPLVEIGGEMDLAKLPNTKTKVGLVLADVNQALFLSRLRQVEDFEVGLLRAEFMLGNVGVHPKALEALDNGTLQNLVDVRLAEISKKVTQIAKEQFQLGLISLDLKLREYVGELTGLNAQISKLANQDVNGAEQVLAQQRNLRELEYKLDEHVENATRHLDTLRTSRHVKDHISIVYGYEDELPFLPNNEEGNARKASIQSDVEYKTQKVEAKESIQKIIEAIANIRNEVAIKSGMKHEITELISTPGKIQEIIRSRGYRNGKEHYIQTLSQCLALFAMAFYAKPIIYRTTDFKSNEYRNLLGGSLFEAFEDNPMLGWRGVSRQIHDWEIEAFKLARGVYGGKNLQIMLPFVRTLEEARSMKLYLNSVHKLKSGEDGLKIIQMSEIPSNAILARQFIEEFDGFSIGSNDMTQMVLATDRDNSALSYIYDEEDPAVVWAILCTIFTGQKFAKKVGFCGQGVSNSLIIRGLVTIAGICSASVVPDTYYQTKFDIAQIEKLNLDTSKLGAWLSEQHLAKYKALLEEKGYGHIMKKYTSAADLREWYEGESARLHEGLRKALGTPIEEEARSKAQTFRATFHKKAIYAAWNWEETVLDALHQAGFNDFAEQAKALAEQRKKSW